jgi:hypothetical protein
MTIGLFQDFPIPLQAMVAIGIMKRAVKVFGLDDLRKLLPMLAATSQL